MGVTVNTLPALNNNNSFNVDGVTVTSKHSSGSAGFVSVWDTTELISGSSASNQVALPLTSGGTYNFTVDWGDGNSDIITAYNQAERVHTYSSAGTYTITITGVISGWLFSFGSTDRPKIKDVSSWGVLNIEDQSAFRSCVNLTCSATDTLQTVGMTNTERMFRGCSSLTTAPIVDLSSITVTHEMFQDCTSLTTVPLLDLSSTTDARDMFYGCTSLTTVPLLDMSSATQVGSMFYNCSSLSTVPLFDWSSVLSATNAFSGCTLTTASYSAFLEHLDTLSLQSGVGFHGGNSKYNTGGQTARTNIINDHSWTFTDGGLA